MNVRKATAAGLVTTYLMLTACTTMQSVPQAVQSTPEKAKNVIMIIGDGMGPQQVGLLLAYAKQAPNSVITDGTTAFDRIAANGRMGISMTHADNNLVVDSAASATQLATGQLAGAEMVGTNKDGNSAESILEKAKKLGKSTGLVSDTRITHATPAGFAAHQSHRSLENEIAVDLLNNNVDVMLSGGLRYWIPESANDEQSAVRQELEVLSEGSVVIKSKRKDNRNLIAEAQQKNYDLAFNRSQMEKANGKILGLFAYSALPNGITEHQTKNDPARTIPTLKEMSEKAINSLSKNDKGFFLMIEAGQIDWAGHYNDTGTMLHEMLRLNETLNYVLDWAEGRDDTLVVVTADHETGGFGFSYSANDLPHGRDLPGNVFKEQQFQPLFNFGDVATLDKLYEQKSSYGDIFYSQFDALEADQQTPASLARIVNAETGFDITEAQAKRVLATEDNPFYTEGHPYLSTKTVPKMNANGAFFAYQTDDNRQNLLAREVAEQQNVVWATGTHTNTPVLVFTQGPGDTTAPFGKVLHHTEVGQHAIEALED
ncbi:alkaline phosphatase [Psychrobacter sp. N25K4-3-2]|uniref:alkaline phosphatase n=1 Tax=Psychrobacter sp. N25K4-3-2 TaxID=2785026 RepID=UPI00188A676D|nr:alkaline phosphatase [Psychrobacter sp. N25K4-3-2]MBF4489421.1 alkaline phosphatase [Psychrobacter sp. N25K4-3-2]